MKERPMTIVLIAPRRKRNSLESSSPATSFPISAAWLAPNPGRNAVKGAAIIEAMEVFKMDFFLNLIFLRGIIFCSGIFVFCLMLMIRLLAPNNPVSNGRRGSLMFKFSEAIPRKPASKKMTNAQSFLFFSEVMRYAEIRIRRNGIIFWM